MSAGRRSLFAIARKLALAALVAMLGLVAAEFGFRGWLWLRGEPFDPARLKRDAENAVDPSANYLPRLGRERLSDSEGKPIGILHPYTGSEQEHDTGGVLEHFRRGVAENEYSVLVVGGSVASLFATSASEELERALEGDPRLAGRKVCVLDYAHPSYKEPQQLMRVAYLLSLGYRPDAVIDIDGFNETALAYENAAQGTNPSYPSYPVWGVLVNSFGALDPEELDLTLELWRLRDETRDWIGTALRWRLYESSIAAHFVASHMRSVSNQRLVAQTKLIEHAARIREGSELRWQARGPEFESAPAAVLEQCARLWFESSLSMHALCEARGIAYLHVLQPTLHDPSSKPLSAEERALDPGPDAWKPAVVAGYPMLRARAREFENHGVSFLDASQAFADTSETLYFDACHFEAAGSRLLAQRIAAYFREHLLGELHGSATATRAPRTTAEAR